MRKRIVLCAVLTVLTGAVTAVPASAHVPASQALYANIGGHRYAEWSCDLGGAVVAAGWLWAWNAPIQAILVGGVYTAGCNYGFEHSTTLVGDLPRQPWCWVIWRRHRGRRHWSKTVECLA